MKKKFCIVCFSVKVIKEEGGEVAFSATKEVRQTMCSKHKNKYKKKYKMNDLVIMNSNSR